MKNISFLDILFQVTYSMTFILIMFLLGYSQHKGLNATFSNPTLAEKAIITTLGAKNISLFFDAISVLIGIAGLIVIWWWYPKIIKQSKEE